MERTKIFHNEWKKFLECKSKTQQQSSQDPNSNEKPSYEEKTMGSSMDSIQSNDVVSAAMEENEFRKVSYSKLTLDNAKFYSCNSDHLRW